MRRALLLLLLLGLVAPGQFASGQGSMRQNLRDTRKGASKLREELRENKAASAETKEQLARVNGRVTVATQRLSKTRTDLRSETTRAGRLALEYARAIEKVNERRGAVRKRLRAIYMRGEARSLSAFLGAKSAGDLASRAYLLERIAKRDRAMYEDLRRWTRYARRRKGESDASVDRLRGLTAEQAQRTRELQGAQQAKQEFLARLNDRRVEVESALRQFIEDERRIANAIAAYEARARALAAARRARIARQKAEAARQRKLYAQRVLEAKRRKKPAPPRPRQIQIESDGPDPDRAPGRFGLPTRGRITSRFGSRFHPILKRVRMHSGVDFGGGYGAPVSAAADGVVISATVMGGYGNVVLIDHGGGVTSVYAHLSSFAVGSGQSVRRGQRVGAIGSTGLSTGPHLHFEVHVRGRKVDPMSYL